MIVLRVLQEKTAAAGEDVFVTGKGPSALRFRHEGAVERWPWTRPGNWPLRWGRIESSASGRRRPAASALLAGTRQPWRLLAFAPGGGLLVSAAEDGTVRLWNLKAGKEQVRLGGHEGTVRALAFSPDRRLLAVGGDDAVVRLWEVAGGRLRATYRGHEGAISEVAFARDGRRLAAIAGNGIARVWDVPDPKPAPRQEDSNWERPVVLSADGKMLFAGRKDGAVEAIDSGDKDPASLCALPRRPGDGAD